MKRLILLLITIFILCPCVKAKGIKDMYTQRTASGESVFFIYSQDLPALASTKAISKSLKYDYTYAQRTDSVAMIMSFKIKDMVNVERVVLSSEYQNAIFNPEIIYVKPVSGGLEYRIRIMLGFGEFEKLYSNVTPFTLRIKLARQDSFSILEYGYENKSWVRRRADILSIIEIIKLNVAK